MRTKGVHCHLSADADTVRHIRQLPPNTQLRRRRSLVSDILGSILGSALKGLTGESGPGQQAAASGIPDILSQVLSKTDLGSVGGLLQQLQQSGLTSQVASWLGNGQNLPISVDQLRNALGEQNLSQLADQFGLPAEEMLKHLANHLPDAIDTLSPKGSVEGSVEGSLAKDLGADDV
jgi:uncharacterized protein YidB (DUF937 family)